MVYTTLSVVMRNLFMNGNSCYMYLEYSSSQHKNVIHHIHSMGDITQQDSDYITYLSNVRSKPLYPVSSSILLVHYCTVSITNKCLILCYIVYIFLSC